MANHDTPTPTTKPAAEGRNIAETLAAVLPQATVLDAASSTTHGVCTVALPAGQQLKEVDFERLMPAPRQARLQASMADAESFLAYVHRHRSTSTVVWCKFDPQTFALSFRAVIDDLGAGSAPGWRGHVATYTPEPSAEWKTWSAANGSGKAMAQLDFAAFLERNETDIASVEGMPTSAQMMGMATAFEAHSEKRVRSVVKLQGGGVRLDFVDDNDADTEANMKLFERFAIGIPVFWSGTAYRIDARLKYRHGSGKVSFWYELIRPDRVHEAAARELIDKIRAGIGDGMPDAMLTVQLEVQAPDGTVEVWPWYWDGADWIECSSGAGLRHSGGTALAWADMPAGSRAC